jgi:hypothetical protein
MGDLAQPRLVIEYRPKPNCKRCGGRGTHGYRTTLVPQPDGTKRWERGSPVRCACCKAVQRTVDTAADTPTPPPAAP